MQDVSSDRMYTSFESSIFIAQSMSSFPEELDDGGGILWKVEDDITALITAYRRARESPAAEGY